MKTTLLFILFPILLFAQTQIGDDIDGEAESDNSGSSVSLSSDGSIVAIGAPQNDGNGLGSGHVRIYKNEAGVWTQIGDDIDGEDGFDESGSSVSLSSDGSIVAIGAPSNDDNGAYSGHVRIYKNEAGVWTQIGDDINGEAEFDKSGSSVVLSSDGSIVAIGSKRNSGNGLNSGHVRIYRNESGVWTQRGNDIDGEAEFDESGSSVSLSSDGNVVAIGAPSNDGNGTDSGQVRVFSFNGTNWIQIGNDIDGEAAFDGSGSSVSLSSDGSIVAIGAKWNSGNGSSSGHVRIYRNESGVWIQIGDDIDGEEEFDQLGSSVNLSSDGSIVAIIAPSSNNNIQNLGRVRIYKNESGVWTKIGDDIDNEALYDNEIGSGSETGSSLSLSSDGSIVAIGASKNDGNGENSGHVRVFDLSSLLTNNEVSFEDKIFIYPNPASKTVTIKLNQNFIVKKISIYTCSGLLVQTETGIVTIDIAGLTSGLYFITITTNSGTITKKLIKT